MPEARPLNPPYPIGALPIGTRLGEFEIRRVLGVGGFGIVYQAFDHLLEREVALKEYMPSSLVERNETMHVSLISQANADTFALGLRSFVNEARLLARFDHPSLVKVHRFWEANGTAYMAMALYKGRTVRDVRMELRARPDEAWVRNILEPLLGAIEKLHGEDVYHRDIAPDNILIEADGHPVLLDFGAARRVISDRSQALTAILKPSYAPIEQYADVSGMKQGPWTDIYAVGATVHFLLLGKPPPPAPGRSIQDTMPPLAGQDLAGCSKAFLELVDWMLAPLPTDRPQSVAVVRDALAGRVRPPSIQPPSAFERTMPFEGPPGHDQATVVIPRGQTQLPPVGGDEATVIVPRSSPTGLNSNNTRAMPPPAPPPSMPSAPAPRAATLDDDATVVKPIPTYQTQRPPPPPQATRAMPPTAELPPVRTQQVPLATRQGMPVTQHLAPPAPAPAASAGKGWLLPVVGGAAVAITLGIGLWWFLTRPPVPQLAAPATPPASAAQAEPAVQPPAPPVAATKPEPSTASAAAATQTLPPAATPPATSGQGPSTGADPNAAGKPTAAPPAATARTPTPQPPKLQPRPAEAAPPRAAEPTTAATTRPAPQPAPASVPAATTATAPVQPPADDGRPKSPSERCAKELPLVRLVCIDLACNRAEFAKHPECIKLREQQQATRRLGEGG